jgi:hypothetical protein
MQRYTRMDGLLFNPLNGRTYVNDVKIFKNTLSGKKQNMTMKFIAVNVRT